MTGTAWTNLKSWADAAAGTPDIQNQDEDNDIHVLAKALVYARTGVASYRAGVLSNLEGSRRLGGRWPHAGPRAQPPGLRHRRRPDRPSGVRPDLRQRHLPTVAAQGPDREPERYDPRVDGREPPEQLGHPCRGRSRRGGPLSRRQRPAGPDRTGLPWLARRSILVCRVLVRRHVVAVQSERPSRRQPEGLHQEWRRPRRCPARRHAPRRRLPVATHVHQLRRGRRCRARPSRPSSSTGPAIRPSPGTIGRSSVRPASSMTGRSGSPRGDDQWQPWLLDHVYGMTWPRRALPARARTWASPTGCTATDPPGSGSPPIPDTPADGRPPREAGRRRFPRPSRGCRWSRWRDWRAGVRPSVAHARPDRALPRRRPAP